MSRPVPGSGCNACGCYRRGLQDAAWATYASNLDATVEADYWAAHGRRNPEADLAREHIQRWVDR